MSHVSKGSISFSAFKPKTIAFDKYKDASYKVGIIVGRATGFADKKDDRNGNEYTQLKGAFKAIIGNDASPATLSDPNGNSIAAGVLYMPDSWMNPILDALRTDGVAMVQFVYEIRLCRRGEQDYSWEVVDLQPATAVDPLAELLGAASAAMQIEDKTEKPKGKAA